MMTKAIAAKRRNSIHAAAAVVSLCVSLIGCADSAALMYAHEVHTREVGAWCHAYSRPPTARGQRPPRPTVVKPPWEGRALPMRERTGPPEDERGVGHWNEQAAAIPRLDRCHDSAVNLLQADRALITAAKRLARPLAKS